MQLGRHARVEPKLEERLLVPVRDFLVEAVLIGVCHDVKGLGFFGGSGSKGADLVLVKVDECVGMNPDVAVAPIVQLDEERYGSLTGDAFEGDLVEVLRMAFGTVRHEMKGAYVDDLGERCGEAGLGQILRCPLGGSHVGAPFIDRCGLQEEVEHLGRARPCPGGSCGFVDGGLRIQVNRGRLGQLTLDIEVLAFDGGNSFP